jgi:hypothetical protein
MSDKWNRIQVHFSDEELKEIDELTKLYANSNRKLLFIMALNDFKEKRNLLNPEMIEIKKELLELKKEVQALKKQLNKENK